MLPPVWISEPTLWMLTACASALLVLRPQPPICLVLCVPLDATPTRQVSRNAHHALETMSPPNTPGPPVKGWGRFLRWLCLDTLILPSLTLSACICMPTFDKYDGECTCAPGSALDPSTVECVLCSPGSYKWVECGPF